MISGIRVLMCSGVLGGLTTQEPPDIWAYDSNFQSSPNRIGFMSQAFGPVIVGDYQNRTIRTDNAGTNFGQLINVKYVSSTAAEVSGVPFPNPADIPGSSGTVLLRFKEPNGTAVQTQNGFFRAIRFSSNIPANGLKPLNIDIRGLRIKDTHGNAGQSSWTQLADGLGGGSDITLPNHTSAVNIHDYVMAISASPQAAGTNTAFGFLSQLEYL